MKLREEEEEEEAKAGCGCRRMGTTKQTSGVTDESWETYRIQKGDRWMMQCLF